MEDHKTETFIYVVQQSNKQQDKKVISFKRLGAGQPKTLPRPPGATGGTGKTAKAPKMFILFFEVCTRKSPKQ